MIPSLYKITSEEFKSFYNRCSRRTSKYFSISLFSDNQIGLEKYAVVLSKKTVKTAVARHKNKRKIYNIISQLYPQFSKSTYIFIYIKKDIKNIPINILRDDLIELLSYFNK